MLPAALLVGLCIGINGALAGLGGIGGFYSAGFKLTTDDQFISVAGNLVVPINEGPDWNSFSIGLATLNSPTVNVRQILMTTSGGWWVTSAEGNNAQLPPGSPQPGLDADLEREVSFQCSQQASSWVFAMSLPEGGESKLGSWDLNSDLFKHFQISVYISPGVEWESGPFVFRNVVIKSTGTNTDWCVAPPDEQGASHFTATDVSWIAQADGVACFIGEINFNST